MDNIVIAAKCAPQKEAFSAINASGIKAVELYLSQQIMQDPKGIVGLCKKFPFRYALHAPNDSFSPLKLADIAKKVAAEIVVFHNIYWEDEWLKIKNIFRGIDARPCIENITTAHEPAKFMRRFGMGMCLDIEHFQMECGGIYEEELIRVACQASHIHLTGYIFGTDLWHTHIHRSPEHGTRLMNILKKAGYSGLVVSEAAIRYQTPKEFTRLNEFYKKWKREGGNL